MKQYILFGFLLSMFFLAHASESVHSENYTTMMNIIALNMPKEQGSFFDLTEYKSNVVFSKKDFDDQPKEILELSGEGLILYETLTKDEKNSLPRGVLLATPGSYAMKFCTHEGCWKVITLEKPTEEDLDHYCQGRVN